MTAYWKISAGRAGKDWQFFRDTNSVYVGWSKVGDCRRFRSVEEFKLAFFKAYPEAGSFQVRYVWQDLRPGDKIIVYGEKSVLGLAEVNGDYFFKEHSEDVAHGRPISWLRVFDPPLRSSSLPAGARRVLGIPPTVRPLSEAIWKEVLLASEGGAIANEIEDDPTLEEAGEEVEESSYATISLERNIHDSLLKQLNAVEPGLVLEKSEATLGLAGRADILARAQDGAFVVIEVKVGEAREAAVMQLNRYLGELRRRQGSSRHVRGILVAESFHPIAWIHLDNIQNIKLLEYRVQFEFKSPARPNL